MIEVLESKNLITNDCPGIFMIRLIGANRKDSYTASLMDGKVHIASNVMEDKNVQGAYVATGDRLVINAWDKTVTLFAGKKEFPAINIYEILPFVWKSEGDYAVFSFWGQGKLQVVEGYDNVYSYPKVEDIENSSFGSKIIITPQGIELFNIDDKVIFSSQIGDLRKKINDLAKMIVGDKRRHY